MTRKLYIFGTQNFADMAYYLFHSDSDYEVAGFTVDATYLEDSTFNGLPVIPFEELDSVVDRSRDSVFVAIGVGRINELRAQKVAQLAAQGYRLASFVSSHARIPPGFVAKPNTMVMDQVNMHPMVEVGANTIIWSNSRIALKVRIGDHVWITSAVIGDSARIGDYSFIGLNATIAPFVNVGQHNLVGAGAVILHDTQDDQVLRGPRAVASRASSRRVRNMRLIR